MNPPAFRRTSHFSDVQVSAALAMAKKYVVESSLDPAVLMGGSTDRVRALLAPDQYSQFEQSLASPSADGGHAATGWLVRFDPAQVALADPQVRVSGTLAYQEVAAGTLEVTSDHVFVYALRPAATGPAKAGGASLFTVRREVRFRFGTDDLRLQQARLASAYVQAGPQSCTADAVNRLRPLLAGQHAAAAWPGGHGSVRHRAAYRRAVRDTRRQAVTGARSPERTGVVTGDAPSAAERTGARDRRCAVSSRPVPRRRRWGGPCRCRTRRRPCPRCPCPRRNRPRR